ncbi:oligopeptide ABC transporter ATP-binding protein [Sulfolobus sp. A20]|uniref:ABC transporter ATP-binding protein n=1 Tax=Sulfolobaceae TaxID=118883 RepID=UPI00084623F9|nr:MULTISPECIES: ABC transporter ATP-binding protein [unclassified Sulfolobus]TRM77892.1 ABC transporter ATP-binding protein [Sulfolobus sp. A20-N-F8]TRM85075.1 ABC transporter ATP-binding protein [Sulfolobus sp. F3]TRM86479.1 ABC transporter ATP-binding protein [Sulfolobus sp. C3]TRM87849.1 ABC transporter ATP-binding protein [Sulfolobus sp. E3]TRM92499.1 ABC transporter ATP-binding protein [Sulfolobus sp. A20-N-G8]TRN02195.1 ABC transporter ATP-binding protein [Sulfolobus sp. E1]
MSEPLIRVNNLYVKYPFARVGLFKRLYVNAVNGVNVEVGKGEILGIIGESGSGKTTLGKAILKLINIHTGSIYWENVEVSKINDKQLRPLRRYYQMIQQDPYGSLDPRYTIYEILAEGIRLHGLASNKEEEKEMIYEMLKTVKLSPPEAFINKRPFELSGGQRQRVVVARALLLRPKFIVADEPVSMLDASTRGQILEFILQEKERNGTAFLFITHDISIASYVSDRIGVMYLGKIVEIGLTDRVINKPLHPYTQALMQAVPIPDPDVGIKEPNIKGEIPSPIDLPKGCVFYNRCPFAMPVCKDKEPEFKEVEGGHKVACHLY